MKTAEEILKGFEEKMSHYHANCSDCSDWDGCLSLAIDALREQLALQKR